MNPDPLPWKAIARSVIGPHHQQNHQPCQDYSAYTLLEPDILIGAIADGAGSASHSAQGSKLAVTYSLGVIQRWHQTLCERGNPGGLTHLNRDRSHQFFARLLEYLYQIFAREAQGLSLDSSALATTLSVFIAHPEGLVAMQVGDGFLVTRRKDGPYELIFQPHKGEFANETWLIPTANLDHCLQVYHSDTPVEFICAGTDGLEPVAIERRTQTPFPPFFTPLEGFLQETEHPETDSDYLDQFLTSDRLHQRTQDDKTLLLAYRPLLDNF